MKRTLVILTPLVLAATPAAAQVGLGAPAADVQPPSVNLDPGSSSEFTGPAPVPQQPQTSSQPNVIVVGPDGKVSTATGAVGSGAAGYYVSGGTDAGDDWDEGPIHNGTVPELHVVRTGDTLWDICFYYFNDPWQWPKIWSYNPQITNPHWIYPGDLVRLAPRVLGAQTQAPPPTTATQPDTPPPSRHEVGIQQVAFVEQSDLDTSITLDGAVDEKELLGMGDSVYLKYPAGKPPVIGQRYSIYKPGNPVRANKKIVGAYVEILGSLEVVSVKQDKRARGVIQEGNREIERGLKVGPLIKTYHTVPPKAPAVDAQGNVIAMLTADQLIGQGELVMVDLGKSSGIEVGNRMTVIRRGDALAPNMSLSIAQDDGRFPTRALGEIVIVDIGDKISVGLVTLAVQEMGVGDIVKMEKAPQ